MASLSPSQPVSPSFFSPRLCVRSVYGKQSQENMSSKVSQIEGASASHFRKAFQAPVCASDRLSPDAATYTLGDSSSTAVLTLPLLCSNFDGRIPFSPTPSSSCPSCPPPCGGNGAACECSLPQALPCASAALSVSVLSTSPSTAPSPLSERSSVQSSQASGCAEYTSARAEVANSPISRVRRATGGSRPCSRPRPPRLAPSTTSESKTAYSDGKQRVSGALPPHFFCNPTRFFSLFPGVHRTPNGREGGRSDANGGNFPRACSSSLPFVKVGSPHFRLFAAAPSASGFFTLPSVVQPPASWRQRRRTAFLALLAFLLCLFLLFGVLLPKSRVEQWTNAVPSARREAVGLSRNLELPAAFPGETSSLAALGRQQEGSHAGPRLDPASGGGIDAHLGVDGKRPFSANRLLADQEPTGLPSAFGEGNTTAAVSVPVPASSPQSLDLMHLSSSMDSRQPVLSASLPSSSSTWALSALASLPPVFLFLLFVSICCCLACIFISSALVYKHLTNYYEPHLQRYICRICLVGPAFALASLIYFAHTLLSVSPPADRASSASSSFRSTFAPSPDAAAREGPAAESSGQPISSGFFEGVARALLGAGEPGLSGARVEEVFIDFLRDLAQAVALYSFLVLMINCCGNDRCISLTLACNPTLVNPVPPFNFFIPSFHPGPHILRYLKVGVMQFVLVVPLVGIISLLQAVSAKPPTALFVPSAFPPQQVDQPVVNETSGTPGLRSDNLGDILPAPSALSSISSPVPSPSPDAYCGDRPSDCFAPLPVGWPRLWTLFSWVPVFLSLPVALPSSPGTDTVHRSLPGDDASQVPRVPVGPSAKLNRNLPASLADSSEDLKWSHFLGMPGITSVLLLGSVFICMLSLLQFYLCTESLLRPYKPLQKFLSIKVLVFFQVWQRLAIRTLLNIGVIQGNIIFEAEQMADLYHNILMSVWMVFISISHVLCFPVSDHLPEVAGGSDALSVAPPSASFFQGLLEVLLAVDVLQDAREIALLPHRSLDRACSILHEQCVQADNEFQHLLSLDPKPELEQFSSSPYVRTRSQGTGDARTPVFSPEDTPTGARTLNPWLRRATTAFSGSPLSGVFRSLGPLEKGAEGAPDNSVEADESDDADGEPEHLDTACELGERSCSDVLVRSAPLSESERERVHILRSLSFPFGDAKPAAHVHRDEKPADTHLARPLDSRSAAAGIPQRPPRRLASPETDAMATERKRGDEEGVESSGVANDAKRPGSGGAPARDQPNDTGMSAALDAAVRRALPFFSDGSRPESVAGSPSCPLLAGSGGAGESRTLRLSRHGELDADSDSDGEALCPPAPPSSPVSGLPSPRLTPYVALPALSSSLPLDRAASSRIVRSPPRRETHGSAFSACPHFLLSPGHASISRAGSLPSPQNQSGFQWEGHLPEAVSQTPFFSPASCFASFVLGSSRRNSFGTGRLGTPASPYSPLAASVAASVPGAVPYPRSATGRAAVAARFRVASSPTSPFHRFPAAALAAALGTDWPSSPFFLEEIPEAPSGEEGRLDGAVNPRGEGLANPTDSTFPGTAHSGTGSSRSEEERAVRQWREERGRTESGENFGLASTEGCRRDLAASETEGRRTSLERPAAPHQGSRHFSRETANATSKENRERLVSAGASDHSAERDDTPFSSFKNRSWAFADARRQPDPPAAPASSLLEAERGWLVGDPTGVEPSGLGGEFGRKGETPRMAESEEGEARQLPRIVKGKRGMDTRRSYLGVDTTCPSLCRSREQAPTVSRALYAAAASQETNTQRARVFGKTCGTRQKGATAVDLETPIFSATLRAGPPLGGSGPEFGADVRSLQRRSIPSARAKGEEEADQGCWTAEDERSGDGAGAGFGKQNGGEKKTMGKQTDLEAEGRGLGDEVSSQPPLPAKGFDSGGNETFCEGKRRNRTPQKWENTPAGSSEKLGAPNGSREEISSQASEKEFRGSGHEMERRCQSKVRLSTQGKTKTEQSNCTRGHRQLREGRLFSTERLPGTVSEGIAARMLSEAKQDHGDTHRMGNEGIREDSQPVAEARESSAGHQWSTRHRGCGREQGTERNPSKQFRDDGEDGIWADAESMQSTQSPLRLGWSCEVEDEDDGDSSFY
uniref:Lysyl-tRNA synthetase, related n=1 Tax=Neospora caninum (strain Liverpool) TaxID=572307 RepID=A0A0F7U8N1_NEOCL|nr:TPA: Lysyl-tRNA synthetase, related [Neospora caninum Liverpool]